MSDAPQHAKLVESEQESQAIGEFLEWLSADGVQLMRYADVTVPLLCPDVRCDDGVRDGEPHARCNGTGFQGQFDGSGEWTAKVRTTQQLVEERRSTEQLLAAYLNIDLTALEAERRAALAAIRSVS